jgi:integrase
MAKWKSSGTRGVRYYEHETRRHGVKKDRYFAIRYQVEGQRREEGLGWASEGWSEAKAAAELADLKKAATTGNGPRTLKEKRANQARELAAQQAERLSLSEFWIQDYLNHLKARLPNKSSWSKEEYHFIKHINPTMGDKSLKKIMPEDVERMLDCMRSRGLSPRTQQYAVGTLYRIWKLAAKRKLVKAGDNPAAGVQLPKVNNTRLRVITPQELKEILAYLAVTDAAAHDITLFCAYVGCRFSEAARLTWEHVDLIRGAALFPETKNREPREIYLVPEIIAMLERRGVGSTGEHVFTKHDGSIHKEPPVAFRTAVKNLRLNEDRGPRDRVSFHTLRHTAATLAARRGVPVKDLQILFGWKTAAMVFRYAKGDEDIQRQAMQGLAHSLAAEPAKIVPLLKGGASS